MPWQQHVLNVALEIDPVTKMLCYREITLGVPRQSGKTTVTLPRIIWRAEAAHLLGGRQKMLYAAQTGKDAKAKWQDDFVEELDSIRVMRGRYHTRLATGRERVRFKYGSTFAPIATQKTSGHGGTLDDGTLDEAFAQTDARVEDAWRPAMITRPQAQMWVVSTAGDRKSLYLRGKIQRGRAIVESGRASRTAHFEWCAPKDADPENPATWWGCMPALGHTIRIEDIRHEFETIEGGLPAFRRAYLNQWADEFDDEEWVLPKKSWFACMDAESRRAGPPALAFDMSPDRSKASISFAAARADGLPMVQIVRHGDAGDWLIEDTEKFAREKGATCVVVDGAGPAANKIDDLKKALGGRCPVEVLDGPGMADACGSIFDATVTEQLRHTDQLELNAAVAGAEQRPLGDRWAFGRRKSDVDISALVAATEALRGLALHPGSSSILY